jgi:hypothetical protein
MRIRICGALLSISLAAGAQAAQVPFGTQQVVSTAGDGVRSVFAADLDGDGDLDLVSASEVDDEISWYQNTDGAGNFGTQKVISASAYSAASVFVADLDGDGDQDVLSASVLDDKIAWYENTDGAGNFTAQPAISTAADGAHSVFAADLDGDGDLDVLSASQGDDKIAWYENTDGAGSFGSEQTIDTAALWARSVFAGDVDGDGDQDVLVAHADEVTWYENTDGGGNFGSERVISAAAGAATSVLAADLDGDGDLDAVSALFEADEIAWYENTDGAGNFTAQPALSTTADGATSVFAADLDGDGDLDVLSGSYVADEIAWYENTDGAGSFGSEQVISTATDGPWSVFAADLDGDGDLDVLSASQTDDKLSWYQNQTIHGGAAYPTQTTISTAADYATSVFAADLNGDGDLDVLSASVNDDKIAWYENTGAGSFSSQQVISTAADGA